MVPDRSGFIGRLEGLGLGSGMMESDQRVIKGRGLILVKCMFENGYSPPLVEDELQTGGGESSEQAPGAV